MTPSLHVILLQANTSVYLYIQNTAKIIILHS